MHVCAVCGKRKPESEFYKSGGACKVCKIAASRAAYAPRKEATQKQRKATHVDGKKQCKRCNEWRDLSEYKHHSEHWDRLAHVCKQCERQDAAAIYRANKEQHLQKSRDWYRNNRERRLKKSSEWRRTHPVQSRALWHRYKGRKIRAEGSFTGEQAAMLIAYYCPDRRCLGCGLIAPLAMDHVVPLYRGGSNYIDNIQPLCQSCNSAKGCERETDFRPDGGAYARSLRQV